MFNFFFLQFFWVQSPLHFSFRIYHPYRASTHQVVYIYIYHPYRASIHQVVYIYIYHPYRASIHQVVYIYIYHPYRASIHQVVYINLNTCNSRILPHIALKPSVLYTDRVQYLAFNLARDKDRSNETTQRFGILKKNDNSFVIGE